uniref:Protein phosphatase 1 regulatory subunit 37 n=1 Tax=Latimeria chalumnae TaxID=7897 RepID=H3BF88_LATCH
CETLEEIFKRLQFEFIELEETLLDDDGASALFGMFSYYDSAVHLNISMNKFIGARGWVALSRLIQQSNSLLELKACGIPLLEYPAHFVARALQISNLSILHLDNTGLSGRPLMLLVSALKKNTRLQELYLADNELNSLQDSMHLGELLRYNNSIKLLDLKNNHISDAGLEDICEGLKKQRNVGLRCLILWKNQITTKGIGPLVSVLPCLRYLQTLNLGRNSLRNEGVLHLKDALISNRSIQRLGLVSTKVTCEGAVALAEFLAESPCILRLDLRKNTIKTGGLMALSLALKLNQSLIRLDLDEKPRNETGLP